jgi:hypothetical protein
VEWGEGATGTELGEQIWKVICWSNPSAGPQPVWPNSGW